MTNEALKFLAGALALVISTASAEFTIANFVNGVRDGFHAGRGGVASGWKTFSQSFDLLWGYGLGIAFNVVFFLVARVLYQQTVSSSQQTVGSSLVYFARFLWWLYLVNLIAWVAGMIIDWIRICLTRNEKPKTELSVEELTILLRGALTETPQTKTEPVKEAPPQTVPKPHVDDSH